MTYELVPRSPQCVLDLTLETSDSSTSKPGHMIYEFVPNSPQGVLVLSPGTLASYSGTPGNRDIRVCSQITKGCARFVSGNCGFLHQ